MSWASDRQSHHDAQTADGNASRYVPRLAYGTNLTPQCDNQQPSCGQCIKSKLPCEAFKQKIVFIDSNNPSSSSSSSSSTPPNQVQHLPSAATLSHSPFLNSTITRSGLHDQYFTFWCPSSHLWWRQACTWLPVAFDAEQTHKPLLMATSAIGAAVMAAFNHDDSYRVQSIKMYGCSLLQLRNWTQRRPTDDVYKNLLTSLLLLSYEVRSFGLFTHKPANPSGLQSLPQPNRSPIHPHHGHHLHDPANGARSLPRRHRWPPLRLCYMSSRSCKPHAIPIISSTKPPDRRKFRLRNPLVSDHSPLDNRPIPLPPKRRNEQNDGLHRHDSDPSTTITQYSANRSAR